MMNLGKMDNGRWGCEAIHLGNESYVTICPMGVGGWVGGYEWGWVGGGWVCVWGVYDEWVGRWVRENMLVILLLCVVSLRLHVLSQTKRADQVCSITYILSL